MRIILCGAVGSGKTAAARTLSCALSIPFFSGDEIRYGYALDSVPSETGRFKRSADEEAALINGILAYPDFIVEGVWRETQRALWDASDRIFLLEIPYRERKKRILRRWLRQRLRREPSPYPPTLSMLRNMLRWTRDCETGRDNTKALLLQTYGYKITVVSSHTEILSILHDCHPTRLHDLKGRST